MNIVAPSELFELPNERCLRLALLAVVFSCDCLATDPGFRTAITNKGLDYGKNEGNCPLDTDLSFGRI